MPEESTYIKGLTGELAAESFLRLQGMEVLYRRWRCAFGEIDLILRRENALVFAEVKSRKKAGTETAQKSVTPAKQRKIIETARCFLGEHPEYAALPLRFDVVTVTPQGICHVPDAFRGSEWNE